MSLTLYRVTGARCVGFLRFVVRCYLRHQHEVSLKRFGKLRHQSPCDKISWQLISEIYL